MRYIVKKCGCELKELKSFKSKKAAFKFFEDEIYLHENYKENENFNKAFYLCVFDTKKKISIYESNYLMD
jgi:hypothetical protein